MSYWPLRNGRQASALATPQVLDKPIDPPAANATNGASPERGPTVTFSQPSGANDNPDTDQPRPTTANRAHHVVDFCASMPFARGQRYYVRLIVGPERRDAERLDQEGQTQLRRQAIVYSTILTAITSQAIFGLLCTVYLLKSMLGINIFEQRSPFHGLYQLFLQ